MKRNLLKTKLAMTPGSNIVVRSGPVVPRNVTMLCIELPQRDSFPQTRNSWEADVLRKDNEKKALRAWLTEQGISGGDLLDLMEEVNWHLRHWDNGQSVPCDIL